ncbi:acetyltransferase [Sphingomonas sp. DBB INV C78]|uniref:N-acyl amino acid synthase FeeM domain-containing protein n=1 Tax=Sphingomonas sp. DBB INV C78 TaxID=3349434 RepID=UPI0036D3D27D
MSIHYDCESSFVSSPISIIPSSDYPPLFSGKFANDCNRLDSRLDVDIIDMASQSILACDLLNRMYSWRGYGDDHKLSSSKSSSTFLASTGDDVVGTLTLTVDSAAGLAADKTFADVLDEARSYPGTSLCEITKFASRPSNDSKHVLAAMFHTIFIYGSERYKCSDLFIEVNPRHVRFYESMLGFAKVGALRTNQAVAAASQLMRLTVSDIGRYIEFYAHGGDRVAGRSLYPLFFSREVEQRVRNNVNCRFLPAITSRNRITN